MITSPKDKFNNSTILLDQMRKQLKGLEETPSKEPIPPSNVNFINKSEDDQNMKRLQVQFEEISPQKTYYPRPSFPDLQYDDKPFHFQTVNFENGICEWIIDRYTEHQIINTLQEMAIAATS